MRSRLLLSVAHLPTIRESLEEILPGGPGQEPLASLSLDDYMRSIRQLAQPTSVLDESAARARLSRSHWLFRAKEKSCSTGSLQDISTCFRSQQPTLPGAGNADPLDWLFGQSQEKQLSWRDPPRRTGSSADPWGPHGQMGSSKAEVAPEGGSVMPRYQGTLWRDHQGTGTRVPGLPGNTARPQPPHQAHARAAPSELSTCTSQ